MPSPSSSDVVIVIVIVEKTPLATREWLYTAITRGKHLVLLVEDDVDSIAQAVSRRTTRTTGMVIEPTRKSTHGLEYSAERRQGTVE